MFRSCTLTFTTILAVVLATTFAQAQQVAVAPASQLDMSAIATELGRVLVLVIVIESAMTALFNWRLYRVLLGGHALRTPIMVLVGWWVVILFDYDIVARLLKLSVVGTDEVTSNWLSRILSALVIAGGSSGVFTIFARLGLRNPLAGTEMPPQLDTTQAWLAIHLVGESGPDTVHIALNDLGTATRPAIAGTVTRRAAGQSFIDRLKDAFGVSVNRFPRSGGRTVKANTDYEIVLIRGPEPAGVDKDRQHGELAPDVISVAGVYRFAPRAIVDLYLPVPSAGKPMQQRGVSDQ